MFSLSATSTNASEEINLTTCGIPKSDFPAYTLNAWAYGELRQSDEIAVNEALIWEVTINSYCESPEYDYKLHERLKQEVENNKNGTLSLGPVLRRGFKDKCQYRAIVPIENSAFKFLSKSNVRVQTMKINEEYITWVVHENKNGMKITHQTPKEEIRECVKNDV